MIRILIAAAALLASTLVAAQSQDKLDTRHDRALAAGYKALMLCGAIANSEAAGRPRSLESVIVWELTGIQEPQDAMIAGLPFEIVRTEGGMVHYVAVEWAPDMPPRIAAYRNRRGCTILPIGFSGTAALPPSAEVLSPPRGGPRPATIQNTPAGFPEAFDGTYGADSRTSALIVSYPGNEIAYYAEGFGPNTPQRTWSVAKSIAATLIGAAVQRGEVDVNASAGLGESEDDPRRAITIDQLLRMASGRYSDTPGNRTDPLYFGGSTVDETAAHWPLIHAPGSTFRYANNDILMAVAAIEPTFAGHPPAELFAALGMSGTFAETDWQGQYVLSSQVWATPRDLVQLGQLYLNDGVWRGTRILPEGWVQYVSDPSGPQPEGAWGYGAGWWTMRGIEGVPEDAFAARGNRGQYLVVIPSREMVIVRRGEDPAGGSGFDIAAFTRDVLAALGD